MCVLCVCSAFYAHECVCGGVLCARLGVCQGLASARVALPNLTMQCPKLPGITMAACFTPPIPHTPTPHAPMLSLQP